MATPASQVQGLTGWHVFLALAGFFGLIFAVNGYFLKVALLTHTGVVANEPYRKGLKYNERIAAYEQQVNLGWSDVIDLTANGRKLTVTLRDRNGDPLKGHAVTAVLGRPSTTAHDDQLTLLENDAGVYEVETGLDAPGAYVASIEVRQAADIGSEVVYRSRKRLWLKP